MLAIALASLLSPAHAGDNIHVHMTEHLKLTEAARDAVVKGDLEGARAKLQALADHEPLTKKVTPVMNRYVVAMQYAAKDGASAKDVKAAGVAVARIALQCGSCHAIADRGPKFGPFAEPEQGDALKEHMNRHAWASSRMWEGLVEPNRARWDAGAIGLLEDPWMKHNEHGPDAVAKRFADRVHEAGMDAILKWTDEERAVLYGGLLGTCATCHDTMSK